MPSLKMKNRVLLKKIKRCNWKIPGRREPCFSFFVLPFIATLLGSMQMWRSCADTDHFLDKAPFSFTTFDQRFFFFFFFFFLRNREMSA